MATNYALRITIFTPSDGHTFDFSEVEPAQPEIHLALLEAKGLPASVLEELKTQIPIWKERKFDPPDGLEDTEDRATSFAITENGIEYQIRLERVIYEPDEEDDIFERSQ